MTKISFTIANAGVPNFVKIEELETSISISHLSESQLRELGKQWTADLIANAAALRKGEDEQKDK